MEPASTVAHHRSSYENPGRRPVFPGLEARELAVLALYIAIVSFAVLSYQQSEDEGLAWMLCRSFPLPQLIFHILRYVGHPALYYLILWGIAHAGLPFTSINWFSAAAATAAIYLLLRFSPFPFLLRALIPFGFVLGFQYAVDARSYALFPLVGFSAVHLYRQVPARPAAMALALALLANVSLHGTMVAVGFATAYGFQLLQQRRAGTLSSRAGREVWFGTVLFTASLFFVIVCLWPVKYMNLSLPELGSRLAHRLTGPVSDNSGPRLNTTGASVRMAAFAPKMQPTLPAKRQTAPRRSFSSRLHLALVYPVSAWRVLAFLYEGLVALFLLRRRKLLLLLPFALLTWFLLAVYMQVWHTGLIWVTLLLILWAAWDSKVKPTDWNLQNAIACLLLLLCVLQLRWTANAILYERQHATYPARATAAWLKTLPPSTRIDGNEIAFGVMPFFPRYLFLDHGAERFTSHETYPAQISTPDLIAERPDVILLRPSNVTADDWRDFNDAGYTERHLFCGAPYFPNWPIVPVCIAAYENNDTTR